MFPALLSAQEFVFDPRKCAPVMEFADNVIAARLQGRTKEYLQEDLLRREQARELDQYTPKAVGDMWFLIEMLYENDIDVTSKPGIDDAKTKIMEWCRNELAESVERAKSIRT